MGNKEIVIYETMQNKEYKKIYKLIMDKKVVQMINYTKK